MKEDVSALDRIVQLRKLLLDHDRDNSEEVPLLRQKEALRKVGKTDWDAIRLPVTRIQARPPAVMKVGGFR